MSKNKLLLIFICSVSFSFSFFSSTVEGGFPTGGRTNVVAYPADAFAGAVNPACIVLVGDRIDIGGRWLHNNKSFENVGNKAPGINNGHFHNIKRDHGFGEAAISKSFKTNACGSTWEWAASLMTYNSPSYTSVFYNGDPAIGGTGHLGLEYREQIVGPCVALKINDTHSIGISLNVCISRTHVLGVQQFDNPVTSVSPGNVTNNGRATTYAVTCTLGWRWQITKTLAFGATVTPKARFNKIHKYSGFFPKHGELEDPTVIGAGFAYSFTPKFSMAFDVVWLNYKGCILGNRLLNGQGQLNTLGSNHGAATGFRDQYVFDIGGNYQFNDNFSVGAAYIFRTPCIPRSQTFYNALGPRLVQHIAALGFTYNFCKNYEYSMFYAHGFRRKWNGKHSIPSFVGGGNANLQESYEMVGATLGRKF